MKLAIVNHFMSLSSEVEKTYDLLQNKDIDFQKISKELSKFAIELFKEAAILRGDGKSEEGDRKIAQANFLFNEAYAEHKNSDLGNENEGSCHNKSIDERRNIKTLA